MILALAEHLSPRIAVPHEYVMRQVSVIGLGL
jgi:hypothetical protein